ncbi:MAG TPA: hypothetical protein VNA25_11905 [Phycisphaerae bacterium]|nr:hypothetical protein [Phycisphaerae bacterium]
MRSAQWFLFGCVLFLLVGGCTEHKKTIIEERTTTVIESRPVITPGPAAPGPARSETTETREERVISQEPLVK